MQRTWVVFCYLMGDNVIQKADWERNAMINLCKMSFYLVIMAVLLSSNITHAANKKSSKPAEVTVEKVDDQTEKSKDKLTKVAKKVARKYGPEIEKKAVMIGRYSITSGAQKSAEKILRTITDSSVYKKLMTFDNDTAVAYIIGGAKEVVKLAKENGINLAVKNGKIVAKKAAALH
jgi:hypothetical protein